MRTWIVTGPTGAGKSAVTALLAARGAAVIDADRLGHEVLSESAVSEAIGRRFGADCLSGTVVDRTALGRRVFGDPRELAALDAITHGPLCRRLAEALAELALQGRALAVVEAAVYFRLPAAPRAELVVAVVASPGVRAARLAARTGLPLAAARARVDALSHLDRDWSRADLTIHNDGGPEELATAVTRLWAAHAP